MQFELPSNGAHDARELPSVSGFDAVSRECPGVHPDLSTIRDDTAGAALFDLPDLNSDRVEMCNTKGDRRGIHRRNRRGRVQEEIAERTARIINREGRSGRNVNYPQAPVPHRYPHGNPSSEYSGAEEEN